MTEKRRGDYIRIGLNILYFRKQKQLTQEELAEKVSYSRNHIQKVETARSIPSVDLLLDIAEVLEIPVTRLFEER